MFTIHILFITGCFYDMAAYTFMWNVPYSEDSTRGWIDKDGISGPSGNDVVIDVGDRVPVGETVLASCVFL